MLKLRPDPVNPIVSRSAQITTTRDKQNRVQLLLIHPDGQVYQRNGFNGPWNRLERREYLRFDGLLRHPYII